MDHSVRTREAATCLIVPVPVSNWWLVVVGVDSLIPRSIRYCCCSTVVAANPNKSTVVLLSVIDE